MGWNLKPPTSISSNLWDMINSMNMFFLKRNLDEVGMFDVVRETCKCVTQAVGEKKSSCASKSYPYAPWMEDVPLLIYHEFTVSQF